MMDCADARQAELECINADCGPVFKIKNAPRITRMGKYLRKSSIDERPQLIDVLIGNMSLVDPRSLPVQDYNGLSEDWQRLRFSVNPGIACGRSTDGATPP
jgi:lipopolysaccharide/colanic/teichoic acid biosynthesis glycosyltransferase